METDRKNKGDRLFYQTCKKWMGIFLAAMLGLTILSRFLDTVMVPQVTAEGPKRGILQYQVKGSAVLEAAEVLSVSILSDISVRSIMAGTGQAVTGETPLFAYQLDELTELYDQKERELEQQKISLASELLSAQPLPAMSEEELALQELARAEGLLARAQEKLGRAEAEYQEETEILTKEYEADLQKNIDDLAKEREKAYDKAEQEYDLACLNKRLENQAAATEYDDAVNELDLLEEEGASEAELRAALNKVNKASQNKDIVEQKWRFEVDKAKYEMDEAYDFWQEIYRNEEDVSAALKKEYDQKMKAEKTDLDAIRDQLTASSDSREEAQTALENARKKDSHTRVGEERELELSGLKQQSMELDIEAKEEELAKLKTLLDNDGIVYAPYSGLLTKVELGGSSNLVQIGRGGLILKADIDSEQARSLNLESTLALSKDGRNLNVPAVLRSLEPGPEKDQVRLTADLAEAELLPGTAVDFVCESQSPVYNLTVPLDALRKDNQGTYVLQIQERNTVLGKELIAVRLNVTVLAKTTEKAAIEGALGDTDRLIVGSTKEISDGSRIRVVAK